MAAGVDGPGQRTAPVLVDADHVWLRYRRSRAGRRGRTLTALRDVSLRIHSGEIVGIVGESGAGKTSLVKVISGLLKPDGGTVSSHGRNIYAMTKRERQAWRPRLQVAFQGAGESLNPALSISSTLGDALRAARHIQSRDQAAARISRVLRDVGLDQYVASRYPHELSGGQRQRVSIARALIPEPDVVILDEPTAALDASVKAQVINLLLDLADSHKLSMFIVSHDLPIVSHITDYMYVLYKGQIVEHGPTAGVTEDPRHPYSRALMEASSYTTLTADDIAPSTAAATELAVAVAELEGCSYQRQCSLRPSADTSGLCLREEPPLTQAGRQWAACHYVGDDAHRSGECDVGIVDTNTTVGEAR